jgi:predicted esterase
MAGSNGARHHPLLGYRDLRSFTGGGLRAVLRPLLTFTALLLTSCASSYDAIDRLAQRPEWSVRVFDESAAPSLAAYRQDQASDTLWVFIEGDGRAWITPRQISKDPTPDNPVALKMALQPQTGSVLYLGRPCQYAGRLITQCSNALWSLERYGPAALNQLERILAVYAAQSQARRIVLVGYSGGGVMAVLMASRRADIIAVITLAANLNVGAWTAHHNITPLSGSLDPSTRGASERNALARLPQVHIAGGQDTTVPPMIVTQYTATLPRPHRAHVKIEASFNHSCCWAEEWPRLRQEALNVIESINTGAVQPGITQH